MNGIDRCVWLSIRPGSTKHPAASMTSVPSGAAKRPTAASFSPSISTPLSNSPSAVTTVPLAIRVVRVMARLLWSVAPAASFLAREAVVHARAVLGPAFGDDLGSGVEQASLAAVHMKIAEQAVLPASERERRRGHRDRNVDANHPGRDAGAELPRHAAVVGEDRGSVAVGIGVDDRERLLERVG